MASNMTQPKRIEDISIEDLKLHRWCYYHNDEAGFDCFEYVVSDNHPEFSSEAIEFELAEFHFANGKVALGSYDGSESFTLFTSNSYLSFWFGMSKPTMGDVKKASMLLGENDYSMPVKVVSKWSRITKSFRGINYIDENDEVVTVAI